MYLSEETLDDLMRGVFDVLLKLPVNTGATRGDFSEIFGSFLELRNPRARLSLTQTKGKPFGALGELLWYLSGSKELDFISYYLPKYKKDSTDGKTIHGGYGPRLFNMRPKFFSLWRGHNQIENVLSLLREKSTSRRAVIQLFNAEDIAKTYKEIPCTCTLQFAIRDQRLHMFTTMRSNDAFIGLPHDVFAFTMLQEIFARSLGVELGTYKHAIGSLHLYDGDSRDDAQQYLNEGWQSTETSMPEMPLGDPWPSIKRLIKIESRIRKGKSVDIAGQNLDPYWADMARLLQIHTLCKQKYYDAVTIIKGEMANEIYDGYIDLRAERGRE